MDFEEAVARQKERTGNRVYGDDFIAVVKHTMVSGAIDVDHMIEECRQKPGYGSTVQSLRSLRKTMGQCYYNACVLQMLQKGGDFSHQSIPEEEWVTA